MFILTYELFCASKGNSLSAACADPTDYIYLSICRPFYLSIYISTYVSIYLSIYISICLY